MKKIILPLLLCAALCGCGGAVMEQVDAAIAVSFGLTGSHLV